jgi:hypothetical protein
VQGVAGEAGVSWTVLLVCVLAAYAIVATVCLILVGRIEQRPLPRGEQGRAEILFTDRFERKEK